MNVTQLQIPSIPLILIACLALVIGACDSGPEFTGSDLSGRITGEVIDKATSEPIQGAEVSVMVDSAETFSSTTDANGQFVITDVPATTTAEADAKPSAGYGVRVQPPDPYRTVRGQVEMPFGNTGAAGEVGDLTANITFPLAKGNGTLSGRVLLNGSDGTTPFNEGTVLLQQRVNVQFSADGNPQQSVWTRSTSQTDGDGNFTFNDAVVDQVYRLFIVLGNQEQRVAGGTIPAGESSVQLDPMSTNPPDFNIVDVSPGPGVDVDTSAASFTFTFNRPVIDNEFARDDAARTGRDGTGNGEHLVDEITVDADIAKAAKDLTSDNELPVEISFDSTRTQLTVTAENLEDGFHYNFDAGFGLGFDDDRFTDAYGVGLDNPNRGDFDFSVGIDNSGPATPSVSFQEGGEPTLDYTTTTNVTVALQLDVDNSGAEVKGYEVYARTADLANERTGESGQFKKLDGGSGGAVNPVAGGGDFEQSQGIIPASDADFGTLEFTATIDQTFNGDNTPLHTDGGTYGPTEWKVRAVSVNNVRSDFSSTIVVGDSVRPDLFFPFVGPQGAHTADDDGDGDDELVVQFTEPVDESTVAAGKFHIFDDGTDTEHTNALSGVNRIDNDPAGVSIVVLEIDEGEYTVAAGDDLVIDDTESTSDPVRDLAGNSVVENANATAGTPIDGDITN